MTASNPERSKASSCRRASERAAVEVAVVRVERAATGLHGWRPHRAPVDQQRVHRVAVDLRHNTISCTQPVSIPTLYRVSPTGRFDRPDQVAGKPAGRGRGLRFQIAQGNRAAAGSTAKNGTPPANRSPGRSHRQTSRQPQQPRAHEQSPEQRAPHQRAARTVERPRTFRLGARRFNELCA